eukprot:1344313-Amorphochlora_amoeboformis.AAC.1
MSVLCTFRHKPSIPIIQPAGKTWAEIQEALTLRLRLNGRRRDGRRIQPSVRSRLVGVWGRGKKKGTKIRDKEILKSGDRVMLMRVPEKGGALGIHPSISLSLHPVVRERDVIQGILGEKNGGDQQRIDDEADIRHGSEMLLHEHGHRHHSIEKKTRNFNRRWRLSRRHRAARSNERSLSTHEYNPYIDKTTAVDRHPLPKGGRSHRTRTYNQYSDDHGKSLDSSIPSAKRQNINHHDAYHKEQEFRTPRVSWSRSRPRPQWTVENYSEKLSLDTLKEFRRLEQESKQ